MGSPLTPWRALFGLVLVAALCALPVQAAAAESAAPAPADQVQPPLAVTVAGMQVSIDPETGKLRQPTAAEAQALRQAFREAFGGPRLASKTLVRRHADGMLSAAVDLSLFDLSVIHRRADGSLDAVCLEGPADAERALATPAPEER